MTLKHDDSEGNSIKKIRTAFIESIIWISGKKSFLWKIIDIFCLISSKLRYAVLSLEFYLLWSESIWGHRRHTISLII
jgi:hypothetical protein